MDCSFPITMWYIIDVTCMIARHDNAKFKIFLNVDRLMKFSKYPCLHCLTSQKR